MEGKNISLLPLHCLVVRECRQFPCITVKYLIQQKNCSMFQINPAYMECRIYFVFQTHHRWIYQYECNATKLSASLAMKRRSFIHIMNADMYIQDRLLHSLLWTAASVTQWTLEKLRVTQVAKKFTDIYGTWRSITVFIWTCHWNLFLAKLI